MKFLFVVQGEGRGHFMQAIEMKAMLERNGHEVVACMVGKNPARIIPQYFYERMHGTKIDSFESPNFVQGVGGKRPSYFNSFIENIIKLPGFSLSMHKLRTSIAQIEPDAIINFYDVMIGISNYLAPIQLPIISIGHQYLFLHKDFEFPNKKSKIELDPLRFFTIATSVGSCRRLALSFYPMNDDPEHDIIVVPPILRNSVRNTIPREGKYIHGYMLNSGFADEVREYSLKVNFSLQLLDKIPENKREALTTILENDPRPSYKDDGDHEYGMVYADLDVFFKVEGGTLTVTRIESKK